MQDKMKIEIWSDVMCPFCYIGKRKFEAALNQFTHKDQIEIEWKSFQLAPDLKTQPNKNPHQFLAEHKGMSVEQAKSMNDQVSIMAKQVGLSYNLDNSIVANSFKAHQFTHFAKQYGKQHEAEELLFRSYFTDGKNIDDTTVLLELAKEIDLDTSSLKQKLENNSFSEEVNKDISKAREIGVNGAPFFLFNRKYAVSGAQESSTFLGALEQSFNEWQKENLQNKIEIIEGPSCTTDGDCD